MVGSAWSFDPDHHHGGNPVTRRTRALLVGAVAILCSSMPGISPLLHTLPAHAATGDPQQVSFTLEGCRNDGSITLPNGGGAFICPDSDYTTGNLGKGWNELDLVPHRITAKAGTSAPSSQTYIIGVAADNCIKAGSPTGYLCADGTGGNPGYDLMSAPVLNTGLSSASCTALTTSGQQTLVPGEGGTDVSIDQLLTITQAKSTTCVYDYYERLALGSHRFSGSSLHSDLLNQNFNSSGIGNKDVSIPVKEVSPQSINKDMSATQQADHTWSVVRSPTPAHLDFGDTCGVSGSLSKPVSVTISWTKGATTPTGDITVVTHVYATNPASRTVTVNVTDVIYSDTTVLDTSPSATVDVPANTSQLVLSHTADVPSGTTDLNDIATATYTDAVTGATIPGNTTATAGATVQVSSPGLNNTAVITDTENITGDGLTFSADSFSGATGSFGSYTAGTATTGPVTWTSDVQSDSGSMTINKTVYLDQPRVTSGTLSGTSVLTGSDGFSSDSAVDVKIVSSAQASIQLTKTISTPLSSGSQSFTFDFYDSSKNLIDTQSLTFNTGDASHKVSVGVSGIDTYTVHEEPAAGWGTQSDQSVAVTLGTCNAPVSFVNTPTAVYATHFTVSRQGNVLSFHWRTSPTRLVAGFAVYAGGHRLNRQVIAAGQKHSYTYRTQYTGHGPFTLRVVLTDGQRVTVRTR
jgi:hypothetical protein